MKRSVRIVLPLLALLAVVGVLLAIKANQIGLLIATGKQAEESGPPPQVVSTATSERQTWASTLTAVGSVEAERGVTLSNDSPGIVIRVGFDSGDQVKQGSVLVELETSVERAQLASIQARLDYAQQDLTRTKALTEQQVTTQAELDVAVSNLRSLEAEAGALRAQIERKVVRAPFSGKVGIRRVNLGQYLAPGSALSTLQSEKEDYVDFSLPQQALRQIRVGLPVQLTAKQTDIALRGVIAAIDPQVDATSRTVRIRASTQDPNQKLRPGMFVNVAVELDEKRNVVTVPVTAIKYAAYGDSVFVVEDDSASASAQVARQQFVQLGRTRGDFIEVSKGLEGNERVVSAGAFKLRNGTPVKIENEVALKAAQHPQPENR